MHISHAGYTVKGEDVCVCAEDGLRYLLAIADGHGGPDVARICRDNLAHLVDALSAAPVPTPTEFETIFRTLHFLSEGHTSGAVLSVCVVDKATRRIGCANVGDVHCYLVSPNSHARLNTSHRLQDNPAERMRLGDNVRIDINGPPRMFPGGLACSRAIGDGDCPTRSYMPAVCYETLSQDHTLLMASDGIWDCVDLKKVINTARRTHSAHTIIRLRTQYTDDASVIVASHQEPIQRIGLKWLFKSTGSSSSSDSDDDRPVQKSTLMVPI